MFTLLLQPRVRRAYFGEVDSVNAACTFLEKYEDGVVRYEDEYFKNGEELKEYVEGIRCVDRTEPDNAASDGRAFFESSDRQVSGTDPDNAE
jgi:hypothetical protein